MEGGHRDRRHAAQHHMGRALSQSAGQVGAQRPVGRATAGWAGRQRSAERQWLGQGCAGRCGAVHRVSQGSPVNPRLTVAAAVATVLASMALYPLIYGPRWFWAGALAIIAVALVGALSRLRAIPAVLCLLIVLAGLFLYLNAMFAGQQSFALLIPTGSSLHQLGHLVAQSHRETSRYAPPVPDARGIMLMATAGIGLIAVAVDFLAVRLRRPAIAGLPLLVLFCVPLTTDAKPGWVGGTFV